MKSNTETDHQWAEDILLDYASESLRGTVPLWLWDYVEGIGQNQWQRLVFGQFYPVTPQIPGGVLHVANGEYDMPAVTLLLWSSATLR